MAGLFVLFVLFVVKKTNRFPYLCSPSDTYLRHTFFWNPFQKKLNPILLMRELLLLFTFCCFSMLSAFAENDSLIYLKRTDTIFLKINDLREKILEHTLEEKQTLYALSKFYGMTVNEIFDYNPGLNRNNYTAGMKITIPVPAKSILTQIPPEHNSYDYVPLCYKVKKSDTLYKLSKNYFNIPIETLRLLNKLPDNTLSMGQVIQVGWINRWGIPKEYRRFRGGPLDKKNQLLKKKYQQAREIKKEHRQKGVAHWKKNGLRSRNLYAMHRKAPIDSVIAIHNPMSQKTVYARVIARIPESIYSEEVVVIVSERVAHLLKAKDARFFVKVKYLR